VAHKLDGGPRFRAGALPFRNFCCEAKGSNQIPRHAEKVTQDARFTKCTRLGSLTMEEMDDDNTIDSFDRCSWSHGLHNVARLFAQRRNWHSDPFRRRGSFLYIVARGRGTPSPLGEYTVESNSHCFLDSS
jgi:hypothetical protein